MSRFDLFFVVLDEQDEAVDFAIAQHIIDVHCNSGNGLLLLLLAAEEVEAAAALLFSAWRTCSCTSAQPALCAPS